MFMMIRPKHIIAKVIVAEIKESLGMNAEPTKMVIPPIMALKDSILWLFFTQKVVDCSKNKVTQGGLGMGNDSQ